MLKMCHSAVLFTKAAVCLIQLFIGGPLLVSPKEKWQFFSHIFKLN